MADKPAHGNPKAPRVLPGRQRREPVPRNPAGGRAAGKPHNKLAQPQNRWQRAVRYVWDRRRG
jgi:hypothetical protein